MMPAPATEIQMKRAIHKIFRGIKATPNLQSLLMDKGYIYSAYISALIIDALSNQSWIQNISICNPDKGPFRFPMAPSEIYSGTSSWYEFETPRGKMEMHLCAKCIGVSGRVNNKLSHELDILILTASVAEECRAKRRRPVTNEILFLVECKNVSAVNYGLGREFIGLCFEFPVNLNPTMNYSTDINPGVWRGYLQLGVLVATITNLNGRPSAFELVAARNLIAEEFVEPTQKQRINQFQEKVVIVLKGILS